MTNRQLAFCENLMDGMSQAEAYRRAYPTCRSESAARANASRLLTNDSIKKKMDKLQNKVTTEKTMTWKRKREILASIITDPNTKPMEILAALKLDNTMAGHNEPPLTGEGGFLDRIKEGF